MSADLIERLEAASEGSRELDARVEVAVRDIFAARSGLAPPHWAKWRASASGLVGDGFTQYQAQPVTTSVDAALALAERVLPGQARAMGDMSFDPPGKPWACIWTTGGEPKFRSDAATPALALCAAILRARQANEAGR